MLQETRLTTSTPKDLLSPSEERSTAESRQDSETTDMEEVPRELADDLETKGLGCWQAFRFFVKHSYQDVGRRKCHFCLAFCSVLIVVLATLVVNTVVNKGPIIFMKLA